MGLLPQVLGVLVLGEKAGSYRCMENSLRMGKEMCEDPGKNVGNVGERLGMTLGPHR